MNRTFYRILEGYPYKENTMPKLIKRKMKTVEERLERSNLMRTKYKFYIFIFVLIFCNLFLTSKALPQNNQNPSLVLVPKKLALDYVVMCEEIKDFTPINQAVVFSIKIGRVSCFTLFDPVPEKMFIYHKWFHKDKPSTKKRLTLQPPRWATYSSIQLRETDKGPWRVEISDHKGNILHIIKFSITE